MDAESSVTPAIYMGTLQIFTLIADTSPVLAFVAQNPLLDCVPLTESLDPISGLGLLSVRGESYSKSTEDRYKFCFRLLLIRICPNAYNWNVEESETDRSAHP